MKYIVELEEGVWIAPWDEGTDSRTIVKENAERFDTRGHASDNLFIESLFSDKDFKNAKITEVES